MDKKNKILVIKLSALGDFVQSFGAMRAIREFHADDEITLLTTKTYEELARKSLYFDKIITDKRPQFFQLKLWFELAKKLNASDYKRVYDLQCNDRTKIYFSLFLKKPEWVGTVKGASHRNTSPILKSDLAFYGHQQSLNLAGIENVSIDRLDWMCGDTTLFGLQKPYVLIAAGCAPSRPEKRWPAESYAALCKHLTHEGYQCVLIGTKSEQDINNKIKSLCPAVYDLCGQTNFYDLAALAREAAFSIGNDTGPMHFFGPTGCKILVIFSGASNPKRHRPLGENVYTIQKSDIKKITPEEIIQKLDQVI